MKDKFYLNSIITVSFSALLLFYKFFIMDMITNQVLAIGISLIGSIILIIFWCRTGTLKKVLRQNSLMKSITYILIWILAAFTVLIS